MKKLLKSASHILTDKQYISLKYKMRFGKFPNLKNPQTYNEKLQWLKLYDRNPIYTTMVDKYEAKKYVAERIGEEYIIPTIGVWDKFEDIDLGILPEKFVLKCTHDSGGLVICRDKSKFDYESAKKKIERSLNTNYYWHGREWPYKDVKPRIIAEEYISCENKQVVEDKLNDGYVSCASLQSEQGLLDYKFMCFDGVVRALFLDIGVIGSSDGHAEEYYRNIYDRNGNLLPVKETRENYPRDIKLPDELPKMIEIAERISTGIPHLRVDMYNLNGETIKIGELTFFHGSGLSNTFIPEEWDKTFGDWIKLPEKQK